MHFHYAYISLAWLNSYSVVYNIQQKNWSYDHYEMRVMHHLTFTKCPTRFALQTVGFEALRYDNCLENAPSGSEIGRILTKNGAITRNTTWQGQKKKKQIKLILRVTTTKLRSTRSKLTRNSRFTRARFLNSWYFVVGTGSLNNSFPNTHEYNLIAVTHLNSPGIYALKLPTMKCDRTTQYLWRHVK